MGSEPSPPSSASAARSSAWPRLVRAGAGRERRAGRRPRRAAGRHRRVRAAGRRHRRRPRVRPARRRGRAPRACCSRRRRRSSATSSSSRARRRTWSQREREKLVAWTRAARGAGQKARAARMRRRGRRSRRRRTGRRRGSRSPSSAPAAVLACARMEPPPGGPPDAAPPQLVATRPDSFARLPDFKGDVEFQFDEVISEGGHARTRGPAPATSRSCHPLAHGRGCRASPGAGPASRSAPARGGSPNRVYRVELLPGVTDLRRNRSTARHGADVHHRGAPAHDARSRARWWTGRTSRPAPAALVEALLLPDSLPYRGLADSSGHVELGPAAGGRLPRQGRARPEPQLPARRARGLRQRRGWRRGRTARRRAVGLRARHRRRPASAPSRRPTACRPPIELSQSLDPAQRLAAAAGRPALAARLDRAPGDLAPPQAAGRQPHRPRAPGAGHHGGGHDQARHDEARTPRPGAAGNRGGSRSGARDRSSSRSPAARPHRPAGAARAQALDARGRYEIEIRGLRNVSGVAADTIKGALTVAQPAARGYGLRSRPGTRSSAAPTPSSAGPIPSSDGRSSGHRDRSAPRASVGGPAASRARRRSPADTAPRAAVVAAIREALAAARTRRAGPPDDWAVEIRERLARRAGAPASARCSTPPASCSTPTSGRAPLADAAIRCRRRHGDGVQQSRARSRHRHPRQPHRPLPRAASAG